MKRITTAFLMALGLALPAITLAQEDRPTPGRDEPRPGREHADAPRHQTERRDEAGRPPGRDREMAGDERRRGPRDGDGERDGRPGPRRGGPEGLRLPPPLLFGVLDANHDGVIDRKEMKHAAKALRMLDRNGDGELTLDEIRPPGAGRDRAMGPRGGRPGLRDGDMRDGGPRRLDRRDRDDRRPEDARPERRAPRDREDRP